MKRPTVPEVLPLVRALYARPVDGCCLHIVLDDGNFADGHVSFCAGLAEGRKHPKCLKIAELLLLMSRTQRKKLAWLAHRKEEGTDIKMDAYRMTLGEEYKGKQE